MVWTSEKHLPYDIPVRYIYYLFRDDPVNYPDGFVYLRRSNALTCSPSHYDLLRSYKLKGENGPKVVGYADARVIESGIIQFDEQGHQQLTFRMRLHEDPGSSPRENHQRRKDKKLIFQVLKQRLAEEATAGLKLFDTFKRPDDVPLITYADRDKMNGVEDVLVVPEGQTLQQYVQAYQLKPYYIRSVALAHYALKKGGYEITAMETLPHVRHLQEAERHKIQERLDQTLSPRLLLTAPRLSDRMMRR